jgi:hypothetical protein
MIHLYSCREQTKPHAGKMVTMEWNYLWADGYIATGHK